MGYVYHYSLSHYGVVVKLAPYYYGKPMVKSLTLENANSFSLIK
jgi:hypothetical protein